MERETTRQPDDSLARAGRECLLLTVAVVGLWVLVAAPAYSIAGVLGLEGASYAALLCLVPGWLVFLAGDVYRSASPLGKVATGMILRMTFVLGGFLAVRALRPELGLRSFTLWLLVFYLATLALETLLVTRGLQSSRGEDRTSARSGTGSEPTVD